MSALPPKADITAAQTNVRFVPKADIHPPLWPRSAELIVQPQRHTIRGAFTQEKALVLSLSFYDGYSGAR